MPLIRIDPEEVEDAADALGRKAAPTLDEAVQALVGTLNGASPMAGSDDAGKEWSRAYDQAVSEVLAAATDLVNAIYKVAGLLEMAWGNHARADRESWAAGSNLSPYPTPTVYSEIKVVRYRAASAQGGSTNPPWGWSVVENAKGLVWPSGDSGRLRTAARAWGSAGTSVDAVGAPIMGAFGSLLRQESPDMTLAMQVTGHLYDHVQSLASACSAVQHACNSYADAVDQAHHDARNQIEDLLKWGALTEFAGGILSVFSFGSAEGPTQAAAAAEVAATAGRIGISLAELAERARAVYATVESAREAARTIRAAVAGILAAGTRMSATSPAPRTHGTAEQQEIAALERSAFSARIDNQLYEAYLARMAAQGKQPRPRKMWQSLLNLTRKNVGVSGWASSNGLARHFRDHGADFGATSAADYANLASQFFHRAILEGLPIKVDSDGTIRIYDPATSTFGSYGPSGTTRTFFKPKSPTYWDRQPGVPR